MSEDHHHHHHHHQGTIKVGHVGLIRVEKEDPEQDVALVVLVGYR
jgi:hypothetical protein